MKKDIEKMKGQENKKTAEPDLDRFHRFSKKGEIVGVLDVEICDYLIGKGDLFVLNRIPWLYEKGVYREDHNGVRLKNRIQRLIYREFVKWPVIMRIYELIISQPRIQKRFEDLNKYPDHWINFKNGMFDVKAWTMYQHDPGFYSVNQIPFAFEPEADMPQSKVVFDFFASAIPDPVDQSTVMEFTGLSMTKDTGFQKFLMFKGPGSTGKSVWISVMEAVIGRENCVSISLQNLNKRFYPTSLFGKLLNACADIPSTAMQNIDNLKKAVGEDTLLYEKKGQDPEKFRSYAKLVFSANEMPLNLDDKTNAYYRRLLVVEMNHVVDEKGRDPNLKRKMVAEADYIIYCSMVALYCLYKRGYFSVSDHSKEVVEELHRSADSVKAFLDSMIVRKEGNRIERGEMYKLYCEYCKENDRQAHGRSVFYRMLQDKNYIIKRTSAGRYCCDVAIKEESAEFMEVDPDLKVPFEQMEMGLTDKGTGR